MLGWRALYIQSLANYSIISLGQRVFTCFKAYMYYQMALHKPVQTQCTHSYNQGLVGSMFPHLCGHCIAGERETSIWIPIILSGQKYFLALCVQWDNIQTSLYKLASLSFPNLFTSNPHALHSKVTNLLPVIGKGVLPLCLLPLTPLHSCFWKA